MLLRCYTPRRVVRNKRNRSMQVQWKCSEANEMNTVLCVLVLVPVCEPLVLHNNNNNSFKMQTATSCFALLCFALFYYCCFVVCVVLFCFVLLFNQSRFLRVVEFWKTALSIIMADVHFENWGGSRKILFLHTSS